MTRKSYAPCTKPEVSNQQCIEPRHNKNEERRSVNINTTSFAFSRVEATCNSVSQHSLTCIKSTHQQPSHQPCRARYTSLPPIQKHKNSSARLQINAMLNPSKAKACHLITEPAAGMSPERAAVVSSSANYCRNCRLLCHPLS